MGLIAKISTHSLGALTLNQYNLTVKSGNIFHVNKPPHTRAGKAARVLKMESSVVTCQNINFLFDRITRLQFVLIDEIKLSFKVTG